MLDDIPIYLGNTDLSFNLNSVDENTTNAAVESIKSLFTENSTGITFNGNRLELANTSCGIQVNDVCQNDEQNDESVVVSKFRQKFIFLIIILD